MNTKNTDSRTQATVPRSVNVVACCTIGGNAPCCEPDQTGDCCGPAIGSGCCGESAVSPQAQS